MPTNFSFNDYLVIDTTGSVGIGSTNPQARLYITGSSTANQSEFIVREGVASPAGGAGILDAQNSSGTSLLFVSGSGNVGVGTNAPTSTLHVYKNVAASDLNVTFQSADATNTSATVLTLQAAGTSLGFGAGNNAIRSVSGATESWYVGGAAADNTLAFKTNGGVERMRIDSSGNVGIGTTTVGSRLHVNGSTSAASGDTTMLVRHGIANGANLPVLNVQNSAGTSLLFVSGSGNIGIGTISPAYKLQVASGFIHPASGYGVFQSDDHLALIGGSGKGIILSYSAGTQGLFIDGSGRVGIGSTTTVSARLQVSGSSTASTPTMVVKEGVVSPAGGVGTFDVQNSAGTSLLFVSGSGAVGIGTAPLVASGLTISDVANINNAARLNLRQNNSDVGNRLLSLSFNSNALTVYTAAETTGTANNTLAYFHYNNAIFYTGTTATNPTERFRIDSSGNVGIGTSTTGDKLAVNGSMSVTGSLLPGTDNAYDMGSTTKRWRNVYATSISGSLTGSNVSAGRVVVAGTGGVLSGSNNFWWDNTNTRVGIGSSTPGYQLTVAGTVGLSNNLVKTTALGTGGTILDVDISGFSGDRVPFSITGHAAQNNNLFQIGVAGAGNRFMVNNVGNVGIGTSTYVARLFVSGSSTASTPTMVVKEGVVTPTGGVGTFNVQNSAGTSLLFVSGSGNVGFGSTNPAARFEVNGSSDAPSLSANSGITAFTTNSTVRLIMGGYVASPYGFWLQTKDNQGGGGGGGSSYPLLLNPIGGNVGVGTTNPSGKLHAWTSFYYGGNATGRPAAGTGTALVIETTTGLVRESSSTRRVKDNIAHYASGLDKIMLLNPVTFNFKNEEVLCAGFIAEDFADIPLEEYLLRESDGTPKSIRYDSMVALLTNGIKELKSEIDTLKIENAQLRTEIQFIKDQISNILTKT